MRKLAIRSMYQQAWTSANWDSFVSIYDRYIQWWNTSSKDTTDTSSTASWWSTARSRTTY